MPDRTRFGNFSRVAALAFLTGAPALVAHSAVPAPTSVVAKDPPTIDPEATDRELVCRMLKVLGRPCPAEDYTSYEAYYAAVEDAWFSCDPNGFDPQRREDLLSAALDVRRSQTPAPTGVDPVAYGNFMLVLDEIIYEMGG